MLTAYLEGRRNKFETPQSQSLVMYGSIELLLCCIGWTPFSSRRAFSPVAPVDRAVRATPKKSARGAKGLKVPLLLMGDLVLIR